MAVSNLCIKKEWEEWKREMEEKRRRRWRERVSHWAAVEVKGEEEEEEEKNGESDKEDNSDYEEDEVDKYKDEEEDEEEEEDVEILEAGETEEEGENEVGRGVNEMKSGAEEDKGESVLEWEIEDEDREIKKEEELEEEEETGAERGNNKNKTVDQHQESQIKDVQYGQEEGGNDLSREAKSREMNAEEEKEVAGAEAEEKETEGDHELESEAKSKEMEANKEKEVTEAQGVVEIIDGENELEEVESKEMGAKEEKEVTEAKGELEVIDGEHELEREVESKEIGAEEEKEVTEAEVEEEERDGKHESEKEVTVTKGVDIDEEKEVVEEEPEEGLEEREHELQRGVQLCEEIDEEENMQAEGVQQVGEEDDKAGEHEEQETTGRYHLAKELREQISEGENAPQNQESRSQEHKPDETVNLPGSVEVTNEDSDFLGSEDEDDSRTKDEQRAPEKQHEDPNEQDISISITKTKTSDEKKEEEKEREETVSDFWTTDVEEFQDEEEEESTDEEAADPSVEQDSYNDEEDEVKNYCKDDYLTDLFGTLTEFRDSFILTDLTLSTEDGKNFHVHSPVLAAISDFIWEKLAENNVGSNRNDGRGYGGVHRWSLCLGPEVDHVGLGAIVEFAYTGHISRLNKDTVHRIKAAAEAIAAPRVLDLCLEEEKIPKAGTQEKEEGITAAEQMMMSLESIQQLRVDRVGCDVILEASGGSLHVHRVILAVWSDYFRSMFTLGMKESYQACVTLPFLLASELEVLINCSYCGSLPLSWSCIFEITSAALQLQYQPALSLCLEFLQQELNPNFCLDVASFAEAYEMAQLLEAAEDFVLRQFQKVACTSKFRDLPAKQLLRYLKSHSLYVSSELVVFKAVVAWIQAKPKKRMKLAKELMKTIHFPLMTFKEFKEVQSLNMWSEHSLAELYEAVFQNFCSNETALQDQCRIYMPKESLVLIGGDQSFEDLGRRSISRELWFGNSLRNHTGIKKAMEWRRLGEMPDTAKFRHEVTVLKGQLYVFGGKSYYGTGDTLKSVYRYDPFQDTWESLAEMNERRCSFSVVVLDGKIYAIGGQCDTEYLESVEQYCPSTNTWRFTWPLDLPLGAHIAKVLQGQVFVSGGMSSDYQCLSSMFLYHPETGNTYLANMTKPRAHHCMEILGHCLYVAGGISMAESPTLVDQLDCEVYNPVANSWTAFTSLPVPHVGAGCAVLEGKFYVLGGYSQENYSDTKMVHRYDPATQRWENMGKMPGPNNDIRASLLCLPSHFRS